MKPENELAMIVAFYLSKFGKEGLRNLGFQSYTQAFTQVSSRLSVNHNSVKNWRDEFDPYYDNGRQGWSRTLRPSRQKVMLAFDDLSERALRAVVLDIISPEMRSKVETELHPALQEIRALEKPQKSRKSAEYVPRGPTGRMAEEFFLARFHAGLTPFHSIVGDRRDDGVGFDFEVLKDSQYVLLEIKGIAKQSGGITFTDKEWRVAGQKQNAYFLGVVVDIMEAPKIGFLQNPAGNLSPAYYAYTAVTVNWAVDANQVGILEFS